MLQNEVRNAGLAGLNLRYETFSENQVPLLVIVVVDAQECPACGRWNVGSAGNACHNDKCERFQPATLAAAA